jgi:hypothetical protein
MPLLEQDIPPIIVRALMLRQALRKDPQDQREVVVAYHRLTDALYPHYWDRHLSPFEFKVPIDRAALDLWQRIHPLYIRNSIPQQQAALEAVDAFWHVVFPQPDFSDLNREETRCLPRGRKRTLR